MPHDVPQRECWTGEQTELGDAWSLTKSGKVARCVLKSHLFGHELVLLVDGDLLRPQVCKSSDELLTTHEQWQAAMMRKAGDSPIRNAECQAFSCPIGGKTHPVMQVGCTTVSSATLESRTFFVTRS